MATYTLGTKKGADLVNQVKATGQSATTTDGATLSLGADGNVYAYKNGQKLATNVTYSPTTTGSATTTTSTSTPAGFTGSANAVTTYNQNQNDIISQMNQNSVAWHTADDATKKQLEATNQALSQLLGGNVTYDSSTGYWSGSAEAPVEVQQSAPTYSYSASQPTYYSQYNAQIDAKLNEILNRTDFSYNAETDPMYQQYASQYQREGARAMNDTLASAASTAGGMNSYAITAAQQANDYYNAQLMDKIPELYQLAYSMYLDDIDLKVQDLGLLQSMDDTQYSRYRDTMSDWRDDRDFAYNQYRDNVGDYQWGTSFNYNANRDAVADSQWEKTFDYNAGRDAVADSQWDKQFDYGVSRDEVSDSNYNSETAYGKAMDMLTNGVMPDAETLKAAGISEAEATAYVANWNSKNTKKTTGGGGGGGGGSMTLATAKDMAESGQFTDEVVAKLLSAGYTEQYLIDEYGYDPDGGAPVVEVEAGEDLIQGKPLDEYEAAASNYQDLVDMCAETYKSEGKEKTLELLRKAYKTGALNLSDYSTLYSKYRDMK